MKISRSAYLVPTTGSCTINLISSPDTSTRIDTDPPQIRALRRHACRITVARVIAALAPTGAVTRDAVGIALLRFRKALPHPLWIRTDRCIIEIASRCGYDKRRECRQRHDQP